MSVDGSPVAGARIERTVPLVYSMSGETFDVGIDTGSAWAHTLTTTAAPQRFMASPFNDVQSLIRRSSN